MKKSSLDNRIIVSPKMSTRFSPDINQKLSRKTSLIELKPIENQRRIFGKRSLQIVKEAQKFIQKDLYSNYSSPVTSQQPRSVREPKKIRAITVENQEAMNFTFAQNFSIRQVMMKEFSTNNLRRKFFV
ncbi:hypothetical protein pb186bvf_018432 [Paramecium bursaria]